jgi:hypothetical protein
MTRPVATYPEVDMIGISFAHAIDAVGLQIQGELAYRPNDVLQKDLVVESPLLAYQLGLEPGGKVEGVGGFETGQTLNWVFGGSRLFSDVMGFTNRIVTLTMIYEFYGGLNLDYTEVGNFTNPQATAYYFMSLPFSTSDMIDNTTITLGFDATGSLHKEQRSLHRFSFTLKGKYGDYLEALVGYDLVLGKPDENSGPNNMSDRDQFTFTLTWYFI